MTLTRSSPQPPLRHLESVKQWIDNDTIHCYTKYQHFLKYKSLHYEKELASLQNRIQRAIFRDTVEKVESILYDMVENWSYLSFGSSFFSACCHFSHTGLNDDFKKIIEAIKAVKPEFKTCFYEWIVNNIKTRIPNKYRPLQWERILEYLIAQPVSEHLPAQIYSGMLSCFIQLTIFYRCAEFIARLHTPPEKLPPLPPLPSEILYCPSLLYTLRLIEKPCHNKIHIELSCLLLNAFYSYPLEEKVSMLDTILSLPRYPSVIPLLIHHASILFQDLKRSDTLTKCWRRYEANEQLEILHQVVSSLYRDLCAIPRDKREDIECEKRFVYIKHLMSQIKPLRQDDYVLLDTLRDKLDELRTTVTVLYDRLEKHATELVRTLRSLRRGYSKRI